MARTTVDIDAPILKELKRLQRERGKSLGRLISDLLAGALGRLREKPTRRPFKWYSQRMEPLVDLSDKEAVQAILDEDVVARLRR